MLLASSGCERRPDVGAVIVSAIGDAPSLSGGIRADSDTADRLLIDSVAQGLVRFDATGQIEPGVAERWIVTDSGTTYIFRLRDMTWSDGRPMRAAEVVAILRRRIAQRADNPLKPYLTAIDSIVEMTPQVIQIELSRPRPDLLKLFAQPEMAIIRTARSAGSGPMQIVGAPRRVTRLAPAVDSNRAEDEQVATTPEDRVLLVAERASAGVLRFAARKSDLLAGGTIEHWPLVTAARVAPRNIRLDPAAGLFGLAAVRRDGFLATPENRAAVAMAIDRTALTRAVTDDWQPTETLLPAALDSSAPPTPAAWSGVAPDERLAAARVQIAAWRTANAAIPELRIALPPGSGGTLLWARLALDLYAIGVRPIRVGMADEADLRLVDAVAPFDSARWYLSTACQPCGEAATEAIEAARLAPTLAERARTLAVADAALAADIAFIPIARPFRWSLVAQRLRAWEPNERAWHPLNRLRRDTN
ncbi:ABC transporter substrate-binding protein [Sphingomonas radiodurans]|uniref:ABC transporter substrate-binding protein n=1 Tax=Sphingomonas radiodurans TaxID=2890321 RepID=UPI001E5D0960|nr:ABC transporter substrate-binding protein [Sphingomonas radiodurans]WBH16306.1 ABC transporter substrate-binding protein [Sphingomonas radiodurans]